MKRACAVMLLAALASTAAAAQTGISQVVKLLEGRYGVHHHGVPALWLAKPFMFGSGVGGLKIAQFEDLTVPQRDMDSLMDTVGQALGPAWRPFVQTYSKRDGEWTVIYTATTGNKMKMLIVSSEKNDGTTLVQMNVSGKMRDEWFDDPVQSARREKGGRRRGD